MDLLCVALYGRWDTVENQFIHLLSHDVRVHCPNLCIALAVAAAAPGFRLRGCLGRVVDTMQSNILTSSNTRPPSPPHAHSTPPLLVTSALPLRIVLRWIVS